MLLNQDLISPLLTEPLTKPMNLEGSPEYLGESYSCILYLTQEYDGVSSDA